LPGWQPRDLLGLIGTVVGIQKSFEVIGTRTPEEAVRAGLRTSLLVVLTVNVIAGVVVLMCRPWRKA
jgi:biopolymer transport protein ExbB/TolQ